jgi:hypothetical protein
VMNDPARQLILPLPVVELAFLVLIVAPLVHGGAAADAVTVVVAAEILHLPADSVLEFVALLPHSFERRRQLLVALSRRVRIDELVCVVNLLFLGTDLDSRGIELRSALVWSGATLPVVLEQFALLLAQTCHDVFLLLIHERQRIDLSTGTLCNVASRLIILLILVLEAVDLVLERLEAVTGV